MKAITPDMTTKFDKQFQANNKQQALQRAVVKNRITASAENISAHVANTPVFSLIWLQEKWLIRCNRAVAGCLLH